jgi:hypothetical protein
MPETPRYDVHRTAGDPARLLAGDDGSWSAAAAIEWGAAPWTTRFRALWSPTALFLRFDAADERPWHTMTKKDEHIWNEEVVEIFLDPAGTGLGYAELEVSHVNVICDLIVHTPWPKVHSDPAWDLFGLQTQVTPWKETGAGPDGWSAMAVIPWPAFDALTSKAPSLPPKARDAWKFNVYRIKRPHGPKEPERDVAYNAWSSTGGGSFHKPDHFGTFVFGD